jgi:hypothetical protein
MEHLDRWYGVAEVTMNLISMEFSIFSTEVQ